MAAFRGIVSFLLLSFAVSTTNLKLLFDGVDVNHDGSLSISEIQQYVDSETKKYPSEERVMPIIQYLDVNHDASVDWSEFRQKFLTLDITSGLDPEQIHLALTNDPTEMVVMWCSADNKSVPQVQVGTKSGTYTLTFNGTSDYYTVSYPDDIDYTSLSIHTVKLTGQIGRAVQQECRDRSRMPSSA
eukprot:TRINITY_DN25954_c0_g1_i6.p1 TRINITY_DN25954_c0_g1~~TRINITY_DN25954_c0_g1_i6.p1  ORF type:complete len:186 (+),score=31.61 TRINITY_DN25954_c0_g1_i6:98-655(+)